MLTYCPSEYHLECAELFIRAVLALRKAGCCTLAEEERAAKHSERALLLRSGKSRIVNRDILNR